MVWSGGGTVAGFAGISGGGGGGSPGGGADPVGGSVLLMQCSFEGGDKGNGYRPEKGRTRCESR
jgi:hypothetical protein